MSRTIERPEKYYIGMYVAPDNYPEWMVDLSAADPKWFPHVTLHHFGELDSQELDEVTHALLDWSGRGADPVPLVIEQVSKFSGQYALPLADDAGHVNRIWLGLFDDFRVTARRSTAFDTGGYRLHLTLPPVIDGFAMLDLNYRVQDHELLFTGPVLVSNKRGIVAF